MSKGQKAFLCQPGFTSFDSNPVLFISVRRPISRNVTKTTVVGKHAEQLLSILRIPSSIRKNMKRSVRHAGARLRLSGGLEPRRKHLSPGIYPLYETFQNQNRMNVLRQESEGEVTQGETEWFDRSDRFILSLSKESRPGSHFEKKKYLRFCFVNARPGTPKHFGDQANNLFRKRHIANSTSFTLSL